MNTGFSDELIRRLRAAQRVVVLTGAGISAESGVPTFRAPDGLWSKFKPEELANMEAFLRNPALVWQWYQHRRDILETVKPNPGHETLAEMERHYPDFIIYTQNVDGLHQRAGSRRVAELHGNISRCRCTTCLQIIQEIDRGQDGIPMCPCGGMARPDVVWFGEMLPEGMMEQGYRDVAAADVFMVIGTSGVVYPAASLATLASRSEAYCIEINTEPSALSDAMDAVLIGPSGEVLPALWREVAPQLHF